MEFFTNLLAITFASMLGQNADARPTANAIWRLDRYHRWRSIAPIPRSVLVPGLGSQTAVFEDGDNSLLHERVAGTIISHACLEEMQSSGSRR